ncbi:hypothetical protein OIE78_35445 (plasmid) [Streptomyces cellulosae]|uniref:hypothetical protein n=1 Tax=Streptomyces cellulosae TaxID=1968 RepID=UPI002F9171C4|nr:hypothetical protein OG837_34775 [Streptomyces cellulosae]
MTLPTSDTPPLGQAQPTPGLYAIMYGIWCGEGAAVVPSDSRDTVRVAEELRETWGATSVDVYRSLAGHLAGERPVVVIHQSGIWLAPDALHNVVGGGDTTDRES